MSWRSILRAFRIHRFAASLSGTGSRALCGPGRRQRCASPRSRWRSGESRDETPPLSEAVQGGGSTSSSSKQASERASKAAGSAKAGGRPIPRQPFRRAQGTSPPAQLQHGGGWQRAPGASRHPHGLPGPQVSYTFCALHAFLTPLPQVRCGDTLHSYIGLCS
ncbi:hypothetical protein HPB50_002623 [Hyalomma asiaticum]|uniref:Uncharacterized protein n=1 Tax=Hyalomma asiaticum TaxID=266040 RepID=A0ACB7S6G7_HYAAI|nr:hypothetical protein HPB50_002623 [Hyalomma asiaticum]